MIVAYSECLENSYGIYRQRGQIETLFRAMKTGGFDIEDTHVPDPKRLEFLVTVIVIALVAQTKLRLLRKRPLQEPLP